MIGRRTAFTPRAGSRVARAQHHRRRSALVGGRGAAFIETEFAVDRAGASLPSPRPGGLCRRRYPDRPVRRPVRRHAPALGGASRSASLRRGGTVVELLAARHRSGAADRHAWQLRHLRSAGGRCIPLVRSRSGHRRGHRRQRRLCGGYVWPPLLQACSTPSARARPT